MAKTSTSPRIVMFIAKKEYREVMHERTFILSILIQLFIASFSTFLVIGLTSFYDPTALGQFEMQSTSASIIGESDNKLYPFIKNSDVTPILDDSFGDAYTRFYNHKVDAFLMISDEQPEGQKIIHINIYLPKSDLKATLVSLQLKVPLEKFEQTVRNIRTKRLEGYTPLKLTFIEGSLKTTSTYFEFIYVALLPLLMFTPAFISGGLAVDCITEEFERKTLDLLLVSPISLLDVVNGKILLMAVIAPVQSFIWMMLLMLNGISIDNALLILVLVFIIALILVVISSIISLTFKERGIAQLFYSLILILLFLISYLFTNSPLNMVTRLSIHSIGSMESIIWICGYVLIAVILYRILTIVVKKDV